MKGLLTDSMHMAVAVGLISAGAGTLLWLYIARPWRPAGPHCGRCGYSARGLPTFTCPECGADLREVGIVVRRFQLGMGLSLFLWTLSYGLLALGVYEVLSLHLPTGTTRLLHTETYTCDYTHAWKKPYEGFSITASGKKYTDFAGIPGRGNQPTFEKPPLQQVVLELRKTNGESYPITVLGPTLRIDSPGSVEEETLREDTLLDLMNVAGIDMRDDKRREEASAIVAVVSDILQKDQKPARRHEFGGFGWSSSDRKVVPVAVKRPHLRPMLVGALAAGGVIGFAGIVRGWRRGRSGVTGTVT